MAKRSTRKAPAKPPARSRLAGALLGPLVYLRRKSWPLALLLLALCALLTVLTQIGGILLWAATPFLASAARRLSGWSRLAGALEAVTIFVLVYALVTLLVVPPLAALGGRVPLPCIGGAEGVRSHSVLYCALNRHYVRRDLRDMITAMAADLGRARPGVLVRTLDAGFPLSGGFPMLPHLGHRDGRAVDLALFYGDRADNPVPSPSPLGYGVHEEPRAGEVRTCDRKPSGQQGRRGGTVFDEAATRDALRWLVARPEIASIFIAPHLRERMGLKSGSIRFQGCDAARHDDHIHIEIAR